MEHYINTSDEVKDNIERRLEESDLVDFLTTLDVLQIRRTVTFTSDNDSERDGFRVELYQPLEYMEKKYGRDELTQGIAFEDTHKTEVFFFFDINGYMLFIGNYKD